MIPKSFAAYHQVRVRRVRELLGRAARFHSVDAVHYLRVEIKRLRAFHRLVASAAPEPPARTLWLPVRRLFRAAAPLRDCHVQWALVHEAVRSGCGNLSEYLNFLKAREIRARARFGRVARSFPRTVCSQLYSGALAALQRYRAEKVIALTSARLESTLDQLIRLRGEEPYDVESLHRIRIVGKEARHVLEILRFQAPPDDWYDRLDENLRVMLQTLGRWHDAVLGQQYLADFLESEAVTPLFEPAAYGKLKQLLESSSARDLVDFGQHWRTLVALVSERRSPSAHS